MTINICRSVIGARSDPRQTIVRIKPRHGLTASYFQSIRESQRSATTHVARLYPTFATGFPAWGSCYRCSGGCCRGSLKVMSRSGRKSSSSASTTWKSRRKAMTS
jgi:hypothetical protein